MADDKQTPVVPEPMRYTGSGTPDMAVSYVPGVDNSEDRVAGDEDAPKEEAAEREASAGTAT